MATKLGELCEAKEKHMGHGQHLGGMCEAKEERLGHGQHLGRMCEAKEDDLGGKCEATEGTAGRTNLNRPQRSD